MHVGDGATRGSACHARAIDAVTFDEFSPEGPKNSANPSERGPIFVATNAPLWSWFRAGANRRVEINLGLDFAGLLAPRQRGSCLAQSATNAANGLMLPRTLASSSTFM